MNCKRLILNKERDASFVSLLKPACALVMNLSTIEYLEAKLYF